MVDIDNIKLENKKRLQDLFGKYNPALGVGSLIKRIPLIGANDESIYVPEQMLEIETVKQWYELKSVKRLLKEMTGTYNDELLIEFFKQFAFTRIYYDFEYWTSIAVKIQEKNTKRIIPFILNKPQRKLLAELEDLRTRNLPIKIILLKARQWGGSTLVQVYMAWIQLIHKTNWHSLIIADIEHQARNIRNMYNRLISEYPSELGKFHLVNWQNMQKIKMVKERGCIIGVGSMQNPDAFRSFDVSMTHLSEVGLWKKTEGKEPQDLVQAIRAAVPDVPYSVNVMESTAKGVGNFFHNEWLSAKSKSSDYKPVFVAWWENENYVLPIADYKAFINTMTDYDWFLYNLGATLESINWYKRHKIGNNFDDWRMKSEFPSTDAEAFQSTGRRVFAPIYVMNARKTCKEPIFVGDIYGDARKGMEAFKNLRLEESSEGCLRIWIKPDEVKKIEHRFCAFADIGGRTERADYSAIKILDRAPMLKGQPPEVAAVWMGHLDQDLFAWRAAQLSYYYEQALLAVETNSLRKSQSDGGDHFLTILDEIVNFYPNLYCRTTPEQIRQGLPRLYGFHTNVKSKEMIIDGLNGGLRDGDYIERDILTCHQLDVYEEKPSGELGAVEGNHDDLVMVTAGVRWICYQMPAPFEIKYGEMKNYIIPKISEASI